MFVMMKEAKNISQLKINLAIISPNKNVYSETFIQNHKQKIDANIKFLFGDVYSGRLFYINMDDINQESLQQ